MPFLTVPHSEYATVLGAAMWVAKRYGTGEPTKGAPAKSGLPPTQPVDLKPKSTVSFLAFSPDGEYIVKGGGKFWQQYQKIEDTHLDNNISAKYNYRGTRQAAGIINAIAISPNGKFLAAATRGGINLWNFGTEGDPFFLNADKNPVTALAFSSDGKMLVTSEGGAVKGWYMDDDEELLRTSTEVEPSWQSKSAFQHDGSINALAFIPNGTMFASGASDTKVKVWTWGAETEPITIQNRFWNWGPHMHGHTAGVNAVAYSHNGDLLATAAENGDIKLWSARKGMTKKRREYLGRYDNDSVSTPWTSLTFFPNDKFLAAIGRDNTLGLFSVYSTSSDPKTVLISKSSRLKLDDHAPSATCLAFSPDGKVLATGDEKSFKIKLWHTAVLIVAMNPGNIGVPVSVSSFATL
jgi:WD40 repeat protein